MVILVLTIFFGFVLSSFALLFRLLVTGPACAQIAWILFSEKPDLVSSAIFLWSFLFLPAFFGFVLSSFVLLFRLLVTGPACAQIAWILFSEEPDLVSSVMLLWSFLFLPAFIGFALSSFALLFRLLVTGPACAQIAWILFSEKPDPVSSAILLWSFLFLPAFFRVSSYLRLRCCFVCL